MKKILLTLVSLICFLPLVAQEDVLTFKGIKLGTDKNTFRSEMIRENFEFHSEDAQERVMFFTGHFIGEQCNISVYYDINLRVHKVIALLPETSSWPLISSQYYNIKAALAKKYGPPLSDVEYFKSPHKKGDGFEMYAIMRDRTEIRAIYNSESHPITIFIVNSRKGSAYIGIVYSYASLTKAHEDYIYDDL